jgi:hypothetical protein
MANFSSSVISFMLTRKPKEIILFILGIVTSLGFFFGGGIFIAHFFVSGVAAVLLGILLGFGAILAIAFAVTFSHLSKIKKKLI